MADIKRKFYNTGDAKGFTRSIFFQTVVAMVNGEEVSDQLAALTKQAAEYELEGIALAASNKSESTEKKDPLQSDYAVALRNAILPFITSTPQTAKELVDAATAKGKVAPTGKEFSCPWVSRVLNAEKGIVCVKKIVEKTDAKGLKSQTEVNAYKRA